MNRISKEGIVAEERRQPYIRPTLRRIPLVPEELFVATCVKTPDVCRPRGPRQKVKS